MCGFFFLLLLFCLCLKIRDIWSRFLAFESQVGDLASIVKVEKRRAQTIEKVKILELPKFFVKNLNITRLSDAIIASIFKH